MPKTAANFAPLSPISFLRRTAEVFPERVAVVHGELRRSWGETQDRCVLLASALTRAGVKRGETVAIMAPNTPAMVEAHFGVPMMGGVLNALNVRLDAESIAFILGHGEARVVLVDREFAPVMRAALAMVEGDAPLVVDIADHLALRTRLAGAWNTRRFWRGATLRMSRRCPGTNGMRSR